MAKELDSGQQLQPRLRYGRFIERYPDFPQWLNGSTWELDYDIDIQMPIRGFRSCLRYQAQELGLNLSTKTVIQVGDDGRTHKVLLVRAW
jgi:hypothetical protein